MAELTSGTKVRLRNGSTCTVKKELGRGGQGIVYLVDYQGKDYALKWYTQNFKNEDAFYANLEKNVKNGSPSPNFLWPEAITEHHDGSFGYLMKLRPAGYEEIGIFMLAKARFSSVKALLDACIQICSSFQQLHLRGYSYQDMNDGNFFINPQTGHVLICDNDNVAAHGTNMGIAGKSGYMAPEIVDGVGKPNIYTDYFSLAVILFILIYLNRPFDGAKALSCPCMTTKAEKMLNGRNGVFILDPTDASNRPVKGVHTNVINRWPLFPKILNDAFQRTFSKDSIHNPTHRVMCKEWQNILVQVRALYAKCPKCGKETFHNTQGNSTCLECGNPFAKVPTLATGKYTVPLMPGQKLYPCQISAEDACGRVVAEVQANPSNPAIKGIRNLTESQWQATTAQGDIKIIPHNGIVPVLPGVKIRFSKEVTATIMA